MSVTTKISTFTKATKFLIFFIFVAIVSNTGFAKNAFKQSDVSKIRIAAVVNSKIISTRDLNDRIKLLRFISKVDAKIINSVDFRKRVLEQLVDEELENQEIKRLGIKVTSEEINSAKNIMEKRLRIPKGQLLNFLSANSLSKVDAIRQIKTSLGWTRVVQLRHKNQLKISDDEVNEIIDKIKGDIGTTQLLLSEILIKATDLRTEKDAKRLASKLYNEIRNGSDFSVLAQRFSDSGSSASNGRMGWIAADQLEPIFKIPLKSIKTGEVTKPIKTNYGYRLIRLEARKKVTEFDPLKIRVRLLQIFLPFQPNKTATQVKAHLSWVKNTLRNVNTCSKFRESTEKFSNAELQELGEFFMGELSVNLRKVVNNLKVGIPSKPLKTENGLSIINVCHRAFPRSIVPSREAVGRKLQGDKLETLAKKYLYDLRQAAFIESRI